MGSKVDTQSAISMVESLGRCPVMLKNNQSNQKYLKSVSLVSYYLLAEGATLHGLLVFIIKWLDINIFDTTIAVPTLCFGDERRTKMMMSSHSLLVVVVDGGFD
jgi:hypothetical protein